MICIQPYRAEDELQWNAFNSGARNGHLLFDRRFLDYHSDRFVDASLIFRKNGEVIGILPANRSGEFIHSHQGLTFGGLAVGHSHCAEAMEMLDLSIKSWRSSGARCLRYKPLPSFYQNRPSQDDLYWLARTGARLVRRDVSTTIALANPGPISSRRRRGAAKAIKTGLSFGWSQDWPAFWQLLTTVLAERHGTSPVHSVAEISLLAKRFPNHIRLCVASAGGAVFAGVVLFIWGSVWHAQYIACGQEGRATGALDGLFLNLIQLATDAGAAYFDFGISTEENGTVLNNGLITQKEEFGGTATIYDSYEIEL